MSSAKHVVVCGAGVVGLSIAYFLLERGHRVTIVERNAAATHDCCSFGNAGFVPPSHFIPLSSPGMVARGLKWMLNSTSPFYVRLRPSFELAAWALRFARNCTVEHVEKSAPILRDLHVASLKLFKQFAQRCNNEFGLTERGLLMLCKTEQAIADESAFCARAQAVGVPAEMVSAERAAELDPAVRMDIVAALYFPADSHLSPGRFMHALARMLADGGAEFFWEHEVTGWQTGNGNVRAVVTDQGEIHADEFVLALGAWSSVLVRDLGIDFPLQPAKGYSLSLRNPRVKPSLPAILTERWVAVTPMMHALRIGGTLELSGFDTTVRRERVEQIKRAVPQYYPDIREEDFADVPVWFGYRPCSPDGLPYIGRFRSYTNLCAATGHAMNGMSLGPITGELIAQIISEETTSLEISPLSPDRYR